jgi:hypothetical protein
MLKLGNLFLQHIMYHQNLGVTCLSKPIDREDIDNCERCHRTLGVDHGARNNLLIYS